MNHDEATRLMISEKYLLGELTPDQREQFEEHFFGCEDCALDVRAGHAFIAHTKAALSEPTPARTMPADSRERPAGWFGWLRPALVVPTFAVLLAIVGYQNLVSVPKLQQAAATAATPRILASVSLLNSNARGETLPTVAVRQGEPFLLFVDVAAESKYQSYVADLVSPAGTSQWSLSIPSENTKDTISIRVPAQTQAGTYTLVVRGQGDSGSSVELGRYRFDLQLHN